MNEKNAPGKGKNVKVIMSIARSADILNRYLQIELAKHGSSPIRFGTMNALFVHGGEMTPTHISKWLFRAKHSITVMLNTLSEIGLIRRKPSSKDGRSVNIVITEKGWKSTQKMIPIAENISEGALSCFNDKEMQTLMELLKKFRKHLLKKLNIPRE